MAAQDRVKGVIIHRPVIYGNSAVLLTPTERGAVAPEHTHRWTVAVRSAASPTEGRTDSVGGADDISYFIKRVSFKLHETYPNPNRNIDKPPFEVSETGWGEFEIQIRITFVPEANEKPVSFYHHLKLHPWNAPPPSEDPVPTPSSVPPVEAVHAWQYDEIVFSDPPRAFLDILLANPPTPLPKFKKRAVPPHVAHPASVVATTRGTPEFSVVMEREERERLDSARKDVVSETDKWREKLIEKEKELEMLKKELEKQT